MDELTITRLIPGSRQEVFSYFTDPKLLETWCYLDGMSLKVRYFEPKIAGKYRFEHASDKGVFVCIGYL